MAKSGKKSVRRSKNSKKNVFGVVMTDRLRIFLIACFIIGFVAVAIITLVL